MTRIAVSGHRNLAPEVTTLVEGALRAELAGEDPAGLLGLTCLAHGADQIFARAVLKAGGAIEAYVPAVRYPDGLPPGARPAFEELLGRAVVVHRLKREELTRTAHWTTSVEMLRSAQRLIAVWDGEPEADLSCTQDVVARARRLGVPVTVIRPDDAATTNGACLSVRPGP